MVTKWKNKSRKICEKRSGFILVWVAMLLSMTLFFAGLGVMIGDVGELGDVPEFFRKVEYIDSKMHREDVVAAFEEVQEKAVKSQNTDLSWEFQGMYDLVIHQGDYWLLHKTNIPDEEYEKYMKSQESEDGGVEKLWEDSEEQKETQEQAKEQEKEYHIRESWELAEWYFKKNMKCYYIWNRGSFLAEGNQAVKEDLDLTEKDTCIAVGFTPRQLEEGQRILDRMHRHVVSGAAVMAVGFLAVLFFFFTLVLGNGKDRSVRRFDSDVSIIAFVVAVFTVLCFTQKLFEGYKWNADENMAWYVIPKAAILGTMFMLAVCAVYIVVCNLKSGYGREGFLIVRLWRIARSKITGECYYGEGIQACSKKRQKFTFRLLMIPLIAVEGSLGIYLIGGTMGVYGITGNFLADMMILIMVLMIPYLLAARVVILLYQKGTEMILEDEYVRLMAQMDELFEGNYQSGRLLGEDSVFARESWKMSMLGCQMQENVEKKIQAEKMKIDLITNVSHDLKTPLTSIISYIDLLSKEELSPVAKDYIQVLEKKSERLRKMIADVFDLSKASSGNLKIRKKKLDFNKLLIQILADMEQEMKEAPFKVVRQISENTGMINSDGEKLYRVLQNILDNAFKYSMSGTRIYVTLKVENRRVSVCVKNVSAYEMNFTREEVLGRFFRGDKARSTEGSGLGLAIAKEFTEVCGGKLDISIDGDVFSVEIDFPCCDVIMGEKKKGGNGENHAGKKHV